MARGAACRRVSPSLPRPESRSRSQPSERGAQGIKQEFWAAARRKCEDQFQAFLECEQANRLMVVLKCRTENRAINDCLSRFTTPEQYEDFMMRTVAERRRKEAEAKEAGEGQATSAQ